MELRTLHRNRGQVSGFALLGIALVAVVILIFFLRERLGPILPGQLGGKTQTINDHVQDCLQQTTLPLLTRLGLQGGYLSTPQNTFRLHNDIPISYLCYNIPGAEACSNRMLTLNQMETQIEQALALELNTCIDYSNFKKRGYTMAIGERTIDINIGQDATIATITQPITLTKGEETTHHDTFISTFPVPLGRLYDTSQDIINLEATTGTFDQLTYMLGHKGAYIIDKQKPYPDTLYILTTKDHPYTFQFFVQGEPTPA